MRYALVTLAAAACLVVGGVAQASPRVTPQLQKTHMVRETFSGRIESINYNTDTFIVRRVHDGKVQEREFKIEPGTWIKLNGQYTVLGNLERRDRVSITYLAPMKRA
jgi:hypothetical protein